jgi:ATP-dependent Clp protease ATP-binding subunit ClpA
VEHGFDPSMGARPLSRVIDREIKKPMSREMLFGKLQLGGCVLVTTQDKKLKLEFLSNSVEPIDTVRFELEGNI